MKSNNMFRDQVNTVTAWFNSWSEIEKTVALYSLLKQIPPLQCRFLVQVIQQRLCDNKEVEKQEEEANDPAFICQLSIEPQEKVITQLLSHLPLLQSGNLEAKAEYLKLITAILTHTIEHAVCVEESRQLLSYSLIHPAVSSEERSKLNMLLEQLNERCSSAYQQGYGGQGQNMVEGQIQNQGQSQHQGQGQGYFGNQGDQQTPTNQGRQVIGSGRTTNGFHPSYNNTQNYGQQRNGYDLRQVRGQNQNAYNYEGMQQQQQQQQQGPNRQNVAWSSGHTRLHSTNSAPPNFNHMVANSTSSGGQPLSQSVNTHRPLMRAPSFHLPGNVKDWLEYNHQQHPHQQQQSEHAPLSPQSSSASSGSGSGSDSRQDTFHPWNYQPQRNTFMEEDSGMRDVPLWLKSLRLHKYAVLLQELTYDEMLNVTDDWLEKRNVTKGARHKIILNISKLKERQNTLRELEQAIQSEDGILWTCIAQMTALLNTPIRPFRVNDNNSQPNTPASSNSPSTQPLTQVVGSKPDLIQEGDIPTQYTSLMAKVCSKLLLLKNNSPGLGQCFNMYLKLLDKCINHEAFSQKQKKLMETWKLQARRIWQPAPFKYDYEKRISSNWGNSYHSGGGYYNYRHSPRQGYRPQPKPSMHWSFGTKRPAYPGTNNTAHAPLQRIGSHNTAIFSRPSMIEKQTKQAVRQTQSMPIGSQQVGFGSQAVESSTDTEINARLDSLCLSVTEVALGSSDGNDRLQDMESCWRQKQNYY